MTLGVRRLFAALCFGIVALIGAPSVLAVAAPSPGTSPSASGKATTKATPHASSTADVESGDDDVDDTPDTAPDNSRTLWLLGGAGVVAIGAAVIVIARR